MNIINLYILRFFLLPHNFYRKLGVNTSQLESILKTKLIMDDRKPPSGFQNLQAKKSVKPISNATLYATFLSAYFSIFLF
jgi:ABC-2 type transport system permease protein